MEIIPAADITFTQLPYKNLIKARKFFKFIRNIYEANFQSNIILVDKSFGKNWYLISSHTTHGAVPLCWGWSNKNYNATAGYIFRPESIVISMENKSLVYMQTKKPASNFNETNLHEVMRRVIAAGKKLDVNNNETV